MVKKVLKNAHLWDRDHEDWYVEPASCSLALFSKIQFLGPIWDPACGMGRIVKSARYSGFEAHGSDIKKRSEDCISLSDYLQTPNRELLNVDIVTNPPFKIAEDFVQKAISGLSINRKAAFLLPLVWMSGFSSKRDWLPSSPLRYILPISPRPSMPPGVVIAAGEKPGNGTKDFGWFVWEKGYKGKAEIEFLNTNPYKKEGYYIDASLGDKLCEQRTAA